MDAMGKAVELQEVDMSQEENRDGVSYVPYTPKEQDNVEEGKNPKSAYPSMSSHITVRAVAVGVLVGGLMSFSNMYFGLQTGWVTMGSLPSTIVGFLVFQLASPLMKNKFTPLENVVLQTSAVATATMPLAGGFVGIIPALGMLGVVFPWWKLFFFSLCVAFFGLFFAVPLRTQVILKEKLRFPSGTATAQMIATLHKIEFKPESQSGNFSTLEEKKEDLDLGFERDSEEEKREWRTKLKVLLVCFVVSAVYQLFSYFFPILASLPFFTWIGLPMVTTYSWYITPSFSYVGQGFIMGPRTCASMFAGAVIGWGVLGPIAHNKGWAPGSTTSWQTGAKGWILWISLAIMLGESISSLLVLAVKAIYSYVKHKRIEVVDPAPVEHRVPVLWWSVGLGLATVLCVATVSPLYNMSVWQPLVAVLLACLTSVLAVRALGETDLNPVSGIGKVSQIVFGGIAPGNLVANLIAGAISEAGGQQAGDMLQDLKTGHLLKASPRAQFYAQIIGSFFSSFFAVAAFQLYSTAYTIPSTELPAPTAVIWLDMAELMNGGKFAPNVEYFCIGFAILAACFPLIELYFHHKGWDSSYLPSAIAFAIGMYNTPNWTIARAAGGLIQFFWAKFRPQSNIKYMILVASGFVLGEGILSIVTAIFATTKVPIYKG